MNINRLYGLLSVFHTYILDFIVWCYNKIIQKATLFCASYSPAQYRQTKVNHQFQRNVYKENNFTFC